MELQEKLDLKCMEVRFRCTNAQHYVWLGNSDWRVEDTYAAESGPNMGVLVSDINIFNYKPNEVENLIIGVNLMQIWK